MRHFDIDAVLVKLADRRIEEAMRQGKFDNLPGSGQPIDLEPMPADEGARMVWWAMRTLRRGAKSPAQLKALHQVSVLRRELDAATTEPRVRSLVDAINQTLRYAQEPGDGGCEPLAARASLADELKRLRTRLTPPPLPRTRCDNGLCQEQNPTGARYCRRCGGAVTIPH